MIDFLISYQTGFSRVYFFIYIHGYFFPCIFIYLLIYLFIYLFVIYFTFESELSLTLFMLLPIPATFMFASTEYSVQ